MEKTVKRQSRILMTLQFGLMLTVFLGMFPEPRISAPGFGGAFFLCGFVILLASFHALGKSLTPHPMPRTRGKLVTHGPYRFVRHPIYSAVILMATGWALIFGTATAFLATMALIPVLAAKARLEEKLLIQRFPEYGRYQSTTGRFLPRPSKAVR